MRAHLPNKICAAGLLKLACIGVILAVLSGCLYPDDQRIENQVAAKEYMQLVQNAIDQYRKDTGVLPIKNSEMDTPIYEKYVIDFKKMKQRGYLSQIPTNAYENGGTNYYVLINVEEHAEIKLLDLISYQKVGDIEVQVQQYKDRHAGEIPMGEQVAPHFYRLDFKKMGKETEQIKSVYSARYLGLLVHDSGKVVIDYAPEIMKIMEKLQINNPDPQQDLRAYLVDNSIYVPGLSCPYYWTDEVPIISEQ